MTLKIAIHGAAGRMGRRLVALGSVDDELTIVGAIDSPSHADVGQDAGTLAGIAPLGIRLGSELPDSVDVVVDFSVPLAAMKIAHLCAARGIPLVLATTGFEAEQKQTISKLAEQIPIVWSPSMSMAVNLTMKLTDLAARVLKNYPQGTDVEIIERHHRLKEDAPSGTALRFGEIVEHALESEIPLQHVHGRSGRPGKRPRNEIGYHAVRTGDNPGEHTIVFGMMGETIELTVKATNRDCYVFGALSAAKFVVRQSPGVYGMAAVLGL